MPNIKLYGREVFAIDEFNNGFHNPKLPMIIGGSLIHPFLRAQNGNHYPYERKKFALSNNPSERIQFRKRAREFLKKNPNFCYTTLTKADVERYGLSGRAKAMASLVACAIEIYPEARKNLVVLFHTIDYNDDSNFVRKTLSDLLSDAKIDADVLFKQDDNNNRYLRRVDRTVYYIGGLKYGSSSKRWPYRHPSKKIEPNYIGQYIYNHLLYDDTFFIEQRLSKK